MGQELLVTVLETGLKTKINWRRAHKKLATIKDDKLIEALAGALQENPTEVMDLESAGGQQKFRLSKPLSEHTKDEQNAILARVARDYAVLGLTTLQEMWNEDHRQAVSRNLKKSAVLIIGGNSYGDAPFDDYDQVVTALELDLHRTAGFW